MTTAVVKKVTRTSSGGSTVDVTVGGVKLAIEFMRVKDRNGDPAWSAGVSFIASGSSVAGEAGGRRAALQAARAQHTAAIAKDARLPAVDWAALDTALVASKAF